MEALEGDWRVVRESGLLPPVGLSKRIRGGRGTTRALGLPVAWFRVEGSALVYRGAPVRDVLVQIDDDTFAGEGRLLGRPFCRFRLVRETGAAPSRV
jgi:hypothetical protein